MSGTAFQSSDKRAALPDSNELSRNGEHFLICISSVYIAGSFGHKQILVLSLLIPPMNKKLWLNHIATVITLTKITLTRSNIVKK